LKFGISLLSFMSAEIVRDGPGLRLSFTTLT